MLTAVENELATYGYLNRPIDPRINLIEEIQSLKQEKKAVILAHYYQESEIQDLADYIGDSLGLSQEAARTDARMIVFAGVHFMAEVAKIICPDKKVVLPDLKAGCSLADSAPADAFRRFREQHPDHVVISYINCSAEVKALSDIICTSSNAEKIIRSVPPEKPIIFAPDKNLGKYLMKKTGREMLLWNGSCMVHELFSVEKISRLKMRYPDAKLIAHPECEEVVLNMADYIGSTTGLLNFVGKDTGKTYIVATEAGILHQMEKHYPEKTFIPAPPENNCACNNCPHMKLNTLEKLYLCLKYEQPEIVLDEELRQKAYRPLARMLEISASI